MHEEHEIKNRILTRANDLFMQYGYSKVRMEEIAISLGISKKTLYKYFSNKDQIVRQLVYNAKCEVTERIDQIIDDENVTYVEKLRNLFDFIGTQTQKFHSRMIEELMRSHPEIWREILEIRKKHTYDRMSKLIKEGAEKGVLRSDINQNIITLIYIGAINTVFVPDSFEHLSFVPEPVFKDIIKVIFEGILTDSGRKEYMNHSSEVIHEETIER
ncbi:MAG: TetR/AcrR family transcriptional regulator [Ignavibacteria bacterium]|nr:TetR/AcrR family transcriptional regulator [Ignavibacteria bacterium]